MARRMTVPDYQAFMRPVLHLAAQGERPIRECVKLAADEFGLSEDDREELLPSGRQTTIANRVHWAVTYMAHAGLVERPKRGVVAATPLGLEILERHPDKIDNSVLMRSPAFRNFAAARNQPSMATTRQPTIRSLKPRHRRNVLKLPLPS